VEEVVEEEAIPEDVEAEGDEDEEVEVEVETATDGEHLAQRLSNRIRSSRTTTTSSRYYLMKLKEKNSGIP